MHRKMIFVTMSFLLALLVMGCGSLRYNTVAPEAKDFHPKRIGVLPVNLGSFAEAQGIIDQAIVGALTEKGWFSRVVAENALIKHSGAKPELQDAITGYLDKLDKLNYSDPELSRKIAELSQVDALLIVSLDYWNYLKDVDYKIAKVGLGVRMVNAKTGKLVWEARHLQEDKYLVIKPELSDVAKSLMKEMAGFMPR
jgi:hypothetical protein